MPIKVRSVLLSHTCLLKMESFVKVLVRYRALLMVKITEVENVGFTCLNVH